MRLVDKIVDRLMIIGLEKGFIVYSLSRKMTDYWERIFIVIHPLVDFLLELLVVFDIRREEHG